MISDFRPRLAGPCLSSQAAFNSADSINVGEVLRFVEGKSGKTSKHMPAGPFAHMWREVDDAVSSIIDRATFAELARSWRERQAAYVPNWDI